MVRRSSKVGNRAKPRGLKRAKKDCDRLWGQVVLDLSGRICRVPGCGRPATNPHHIFSKIYANTRYDIENGFAMCWAHHKHLAHMKHEEFRDVVITTLGEDRFMRLKVRALMREPRGCREYGLIYLALEKLKEKGK